MIVLWSVRWCVQVVVLCWRVLQEVLATLTYPAVHRWSVQSLCAPTNSTGLSFGSTLNSPKVEESKSKVEQSRVH